MKTILGVLLFFLSVLLFSCQKEADLTNPNTNTNNGDKLVKVVDKDGNDSTVTTYSYDAQGRIIEEKITGMWNGIDVGYTTKVVRNSSGIITSKIEIDPQFSVDSVVTFFHYSSGKYTSSVSTIIFFGFTSSDSTIYSYNSSGKIIKDETYLSINGSPFALTLKNDYVYDAGGNLLSQKRSNYDLSTSTFTEEYTLSYTYDTKTSPLVLGNESIFMYILYYAGPNNPTGYNYVEPASPMNNESAALTYTYNTANKPSTAVQRSGTSTLNITFFYQ